MRRRGVVSQATYDAAPAKARGPIGSLLVHWAVIDQADDDLLAGAYWAFAEAFDAFFGPVLGPELFDQATQLEELRGGTWVPVA